MASPQLIDVIQPVEKPMHKIKIVSHLTLFALLSCACAAFSQDYPSRPVRWLVPFAPGGSGDAVARVIGQRIGESLGQQVVVENRPGGNTIIATMAAVKSPADGYTVLQAVDATITMLPSLYSDLPYKISDLIPIGMLVQQPMLLSSSSKSAAGKSLQQLVSYAKANAGKVNFGVGSINSQIIFELLKAAAGIEVLTVPYKGGGDTIKALVAGTVEVAISDVTPALAQIRAGQLHGLAASGTRRSPSLPNVPTFLESGYQVEAQTWFGLFSPAGTSRPIVMRLNQEINQAVKDPEVIKRLNSFGLEPAGTTPDQFAEAIKVESARWSNLIKERAIKPM